MDQGVVENACSLSRKLVGNVNLVVLIAMIENCKLFLISSPQAYSPTVLIKPLLIKGSLSHNLVLFIPQIEAIYKQIGPYFSMTVPHD